MGSRGWLFGQRSYVGVEPRTTLVSIDIEGVLSESGDLAADQFAAESKNEPIAMYSARERWLKSRVPARMGTIITWNPGRN